MATSSRAAFNTLKQFASHFTKDPHPVGRYPTTQGIQGPCFRRMGAHVARAGVGYVIAVSAVMFWPLPVAWVMGKVGI